jgi:hypothetical protein
MANNWAIVVGINNYKFLPNASLKFAEQDALAIRQFLCEEAGFAADQVLLCGDGTAGSREATRPMLRQILLNELHRAQNADNLWFFFSGHGLSDQRDYLMPIDGNPHDLHDTAIPIHFVVDQLRACKAKNIVLILDMCRDERPETERKSVESMEALRQLVQDQEGQQGIITLFSCGRGESSYEVPGLGQGAFTHALLEGLRRQSILRDLETYLAQRVPELHRLAGRATRKQVPLVIPEPGWKYDKPILSHHSPAVDVARLKAMAIDAESDRDLEKAIRLWEQVNLLAIDPEDRRRAIYKIKWLSSNQSSTGNIVVMHDAFGTSIQQPVVEIQARLPVALEQQSQHQIDGVPLKSEKGIDYRYLRNLLKAGKWEEADLATSNVMLKLTKRELEDWLDEDSLKKIPCLDLKTIDQLWVEASNGKFGFSIQKQIWEECGAVSGYDREDYKDFCDCVGWRIKGRWTNYHRDLKKNPSLSPPGELPCKWASWGPGVYFLASRLEACRI